MDREALVARHRIVRCGFDRELPLQVGNGRFAFGADATGLQSFVPFAVLSDWGWHSDPLPAGKAVADYRGTDWGGGVRYWTGDDAEPELHDWLRGNPHRVNLGRIGMRLLRPDGNDAREADLADTHQQLDLWTGLLTSRFTLGGHPVAVETACHPDQDALGVRITSPLLALGRLRLFVDFPYATASGRGKFDDAPYVGDWDHPDRHRTELRRRGPGEAAIRHTLDATAYDVALALPADAALARVAPDRHRYEITPAGGEPLALSCHFAPHTDTAAPTPAPAAVAAASAARWPAFWRSGGAVDLSGSADPRRHTLERRIVRSQYHLAVNGAGSAPPQESGLVNNGWYGKFHLEMYWWHAAHQALWNRWPLLRRSTGVYRRLLDAARATAAAQGHPGARWPKMTTDHGSAAGRESPGVPTALLLWQQPHPIFLAELDHRAHPGRATLDAWREIVHETAAFMASLPHREPGGRRSLAPPLVCCNERNPPAATANPAFELSYWRFGLRIAQLWRERLGEPRDPGWDEVLDRLAPLPVEDGRYVQWEGVADMWTAHNTNHPDPVAAYGMLPGDGVDVPAMRATAAAVRASWPVDNLYSWDFPLLAMNAARLGDPEAAVDFLLHGSFGFDDATGLPLSGKDGVPSPYFPAAGGLLYAVAMMCAGWDGRDGAPDGSAPDGDAPDGSAPGFPSRGWDVRWENLAPAP
ncbi:hypothetical protein BIV57_06010 [Mangrovactinospora gilvigrisea]|uniref:Glycoside hydrolase family 65 n=1 Tax=Mangrovactinospora gilvigrisea TaxID=1428644 RepID=A0A1J7CAA5_9ACTN|nr:hypothetical protein BIV57_06010 [Mangrovactinospora gilvigrisea]